MSGMRIVRHDPARDPAAPARPGDERLGAGVLGLGPLGNLQAGIVADHFGAPAALVLGAGPAAWRSPHLRAA